MSAIPIRLVPPFPGLNFLGRVEVQYNNTWGTVCDDNIRSLQLAHIVCRARNFTRALCGVNAGRYGPGSGEYTSKGFRGREREICRKGRCGQLTRRGVGIYGPGSGDCTSKA